MNNDLISRSELKKALDEQMNFDENCRDSVFGIIDNAPTIEFSKEICSACGRYIREKGEIE